VAEGTLAELRRQAGESTDASTSLEDTFLALVTERAQAA